MQESGYIKFNRYQSANEFAAFGTVVTERIFSLEEFIELCAQFPDLQLEREHTGKITIMAPVAGGSGKRETRLQFYIAQWCYTNGKGEVYSPSTGFILPDTATKSPDCAWVSDETLAKLTAREAENSFLKIAPDFVVEIRSKTDSLKKLQQKMEQTWLKNGVKLAWLIDPYEEKVHIYRPNQAVEIVANFAENTLSGEALMPGLEVPLTPFQVKQ